MKKFQNESEDSYEKSSILEHYTKKIGLQFGRGLKKDFGDRRGNLFSGLPCYNKWTTLWSTGGFILEKKKKEKGTGNLK